MRRDPRVSLSVFDLEDPLKYVEIRGRAEITEDGGRELINELSHKYDGKDFRTEPPEVVRVVVRVVDAGSECEVQVEDTGLGIPASELPHIFESYRQAHLGKGGTGLGLSIVRGLVQAHRGRVTVESQEGKGSRFTVLLPREAPRR